MLWFVFQNGAVGADQRQFVYLTSRAIALPSWDAGCADDDKTGRQLKAGPWAKLATSLGIKD
ncbi:MAG: hypothetical protein C0473_04210 [Cyanobacteria bacterium DS3.002]|nr:hypothetical protein [Cyanobacteria bacterium DS3.002]